ncbi:MAG: glycosyltransferase family A protein [Balneolales bacterium]
MQREKDFVSVVIPCYNHGAYIGDTLQSVLNQTYHNYEIIIVDDGSDDLHTRVVLDEIDHPKVTVLRKVNGHVSSARNHGIKFSKGEYILTLDADDQFMPDFLEKAVPILKKRPEIGVVTCNAYIFDPKGNISTHDKKGGEAKDFLTVNNCLASALFRYQCWQEADGYDETMKNGYEDWDFWLSVTSSGWLIHSIPEYLYRYRDTPNSMLKQVPEQRPELMKRIVIKHEAVFRENIVAVIYSKELKLQHSKNKIIKSLAYRVGTAILSPLRLLFALYRARRKPITNHSEQQLVCYEKKTLSV